MRTQFIILAVATALVLGVGAVPVRAAAPLVGGDPAIEWQHLVGGNLTEWASSARQTPDGGYVLLCDSASSLSGDVAGTNHGSHDLWVIKVAGNGALQWQRLLGGSGEDLGVSVLPTADGGYLVLGNTESNRTGDVTGTNHGSLDFWIVKLDSAGGVVWDRLLGGAGMEMNPSIAPTADGGFILIGETSSSASGDVAGTKHGDSLDIWVVKLSAAGVIEWQRLLGSAGDELAGSVEPTADGGYILLGSTDSGQDGDVTGANHGTYAPGSSYDLWVVRLDHTGAIQWDRLLGGSARDESAAIRQTADGGYIILGDTDSSVSGDVTGTNHGLYDLWVVRLDGAGTTVWQRLFGGSATDGALTIETEADGGYAVLGSSRSSASGDVTGTNHGLTDTWVLKLSATGVVQWSRLLGGDRYDPPSDLRPTRDGGYLVLGYTYSSATGDVAGTNHGEADVWVVKLKPAPTLRLEAGWNFVSVPAVLAPGADTAAIFAGVDTDGRSIFLYNATAKAWAPMTPSTRVRPLDGIWCYARTASAVPLTFDPNPQAVPPARELAAGWNAIGHAGEQPVAARDALSSVARTWSTLRGFDQFAQAYEVPVFSGGSGAYADTREMWPGKGYWLWMREPGWLAGV